jgi:hypothetical protein
VNAIAPYWKLIQYVLLAVGGAFAVAIHDGSIDGHDWANLAILAAGALGVYFAKNTPEQPWAKTVVAVFTAGVAVLTSAWTDGTIGTDEWVQVVMALIAAANVGVVTNVPPGPQPEAPVASLDAHRDAGAIE